MAVHQRPVEAQLVAAHERLRAWSEWTEAQPRLAELEARVRELTAEAEHCERQQSAASDQKTALAIELREVQERQQALQDELRRAAEDVQRLSPPSPDWEASGEPVSCDGGLGSLARAYRQASADHRDLAKKVEGLFGEVEHQTAGRHVGADEAETVARLEDELAALADRERSVEELWTSLVDGLRSAFKGLDEAVAELRRQVARLTQALARRRISNLERVELELVPQRDLLGRLRAVIDVEAAPLFAGAEGRSRAARDIASWMEDRPRIELGELFELRFRVVDRAGATKTFASLRQIESQGTSTTIKVLVHLELLAAMLLTDESVSVPFFLDEVATLDESNLRGLIEHATAMGFVPVVASPEARDTVDTLYFLRPGTGGIVLDHTSRLILSREDAGGA